MTSVLSELTAIFADDDAAKAHAVAVLKRVNTRLDRDSGARTRCNNFNTPFCFGWISSSCPDDVTDFHRRPASRVGWVYEAGLSSVVPRTSESKEAVAAFCRAHGITLRKSWTRKQMIQAILKA